MNEVLALLIQRKKNLDAQYKRTPTIHTYIRKSELDYLLKRIYDQTSCTPDFEPTEARCQTKPHSRNPRLDSNGRLVNGYL